jgi:hypothetical protein
MPTFEIARAIVCGRVKHAFLVCGQHPEESILTSIIDAAGPSSEPIFLSDVISGVRDILEEAVQAAKGQYPILQWTYIGNVFLHNAFPKELISGSTPQWKDEKRFICDLRFVSKNTLEKAHAACLDAFRTRFRVDPDIRTLRDPLVLPCGHVFPVSKGEVLTCALFGLEPIP